MSCWKTPTWPRFNHLAAFQVLLEAVKTVQYVVLLLRFVFFFLVLLKKKINYKTKDSSIFITAPLTKRRQTQGNAGLWSGPDYPDVDVTSSLTAQWHPASLGPLLLCPFYFSWRWSGRCSRGRREGRRGVSRFSQKLFSFLADWWSRGSEGLRKNKLVDSYVTFTYKCMGW